MMTRILAHLRDRRGTVAEELALVAPIFIIILLITIELGYMIFTQSVIDGAARSAARLVRTGQAQAAGDPLGTFQAALCTNLAGVVPCGSVATDVESFATFSTMSPTAIAKDNKGNVTNSAFTPGGPNAAVAVRVAYTYHFVTPLVSQFLNPGGNGVVLLSTVIFKNEPYPSGP